MLALKVSILFVIIGIVYCGDQNSQPASSVFDLNLSSDLSDFNKALQLRDRDDVGRLLQEKCERNGGPNAFNAARGALAAGNTCYRTIFDEIAQSAGSQPDKLALFRMVCAKQSQLEGCFDGVAAGLRPCLVASETHYLVDAKTAFHDLFEFACANNAEKMAEFLSVDATNCRVSHKDELNRCVLDNIDPNQIFDFDTTGVTSENVLQRFFSAERCGKVYDAKSCVVNVLRQCENAVSADFVSSAFDIIIRGTPCKDHSPGATRSFSRSHVSRVGR